MRELTQEQIDYIIENCSRYDEDDMYSKYDEFLDDMYGDIEIGYCTFSPSMVLRECDPTAHRCGFIDWMDGEPYTEIDGDYYEDDEIDRALEDFEDEVDDWMDEDIDEDEETDPDLIDVLHEIESEDEED